ncbi:MAG: class I SAM-dependent methyltransferase [Pirellulaceae bacterium]
MPPPSHWQLPPGVPRGTWEYGQSALVTGGYDQDLAGHPLFELDQRVLERWIPPVRDGERKWVADLGCGTGRAVLHLARRGLDGLAVDLSDRMLAIVRRQASVEGLRVHCVRANLVELECLASESVDYALSLFSTLGMIQGRANRRRALAHMARILVPGGRCVLHVHNLWFNLYDPGGWRWLLRSQWQAWVRRDWELGDKYFSFRDVGQMYLHVFTEGELRADVRSAGLRILEWIPLAPARDGSLKFPWFLSGLRANGWIVVCSKGEDAESEVLRLPLREGAESEVL